jgi:glycosyltransferase involved in cell wall biosynthesis
MASLVLVVPGRLDTLTGGYGYDRRIARGLGELGWSVSIVELDASFPFPTPSALAHAARAFSALSDGEVVMVDGLAFGAMPELAAREAARLTLVALVHHPLARETGLTADASARLADDEARALATVRLVVVTSRATAATLAGYGVDPARVAVVEPGTDPAPLAGGPDEAWTEPRLLSVATLVPRKGHDVLLEALERLRDRPWTLTCVGSLDRDPATAARVRERLLTSGLAPRVTLEGEVDGDRLAAFYDRAHLFVLPTRYEGYGMAVAEALARGLPVVSTPTGAIADLVGPDAGLLVPPGDAGALAAALDRALFEPNCYARLRAGARRARSRLPTWEASARLMGAALERAGESADGRLQR